ncbi:hypothetical protein [Dokdonia sp. Hel_I_53]|uniref:hypothetical protein n=1 Tax=Dokdonia sp. Hel_I_53 TaxID=1566287 RepID=UPI001199595A|nr:hypothetical protein [Dokdonia sp. Hel_I_53]TVZ53192.1 hypothetical protein OD90_2391 [Dokdonia sp. Hel_I_53]
MRYILLIAFYCCSHLPSLQAQESVFFTKKILVDSTNTSLGIEVRNLNSIKNKEYFNYIADGETILGTQLQTSLYYKASKEITLYAGVFLYKNFGEDRLDTAIPVFTAQYIKNSHHFTIGNLDARDNHGLIEPLMSNEKVLNERVLETGFSYTYRAEKTHLETWIDWENFIEPLDKEREIFTLGLNFKHLFVSTPKSKLSTSLQHIYYHKGGQINQKNRFSDDDASLKVNLNSTALGVAYAYHLNQKNVLFGSMYGLYSASNESNDTYSFMSGNAIYGFVGYQYDDWKFFTGYYKANGFTSAKSNTILNTYSTKTDNNSFNGIPDERYASHTEKYRELAFARFQYKKELAPEIFLGIQAAIYYQMNDALLENYEFLGNEKGQLDYNYGIFLTFSNIFGF